MLSPNVPQGVTTPLVLPLALVSTDPRPTAVQASSSSRRADLLDDKAVREEIENREGSDLVSPDWPHRYANTLKSLVAEAQQRKVPASALGRSISKLPSG